MHPNLWRVEDHQAHLKTARMSARVNLLDPAAGVDQLEIDSCKVSGARILQVDLPPLERTNRAALVEYYPRCGDLVATYAQSAARAFRTQIYWSAVENNAAATIDLVVSTQTSLLDARVALRAQSSVQALSLFRLVDLHSEHFDLIDPLSVEPLRLDHRTGNGCFVLRLATCDLSYVEMIHPIDFRTVRIETKAQANDVAVGYPLSLHYDLFTDNLEKGVILRARARGVFVPRAGDLAAAARKYREFVDSRLPLET